MSSLPPMVKVKLKASVRGEYVGRHRPGVAPGTAAQRMRAQVEARRRESLRAVVAMTRSRGLVKPPPPPPVAVVGPPARFTRTVVDLTAGYGLWGRPQWAGGQA